MLRTSLYSFPRINEISFRKRSVQSKYSRTPTLGAKARRLIDTVRTDVASRARRGFPLTHFGSAKEERPISGPGAGDVARAKGLFLATHVTRWPSMWRLRFRRLRSIYLTERSPSSIENSWRETSGMAAAKKTYGTPSANRWQFSRAPLCAPS